MDLMDGDEAEWQNLTMAILELEWKKMVTLKEQFLLTILEEDITSRQGWITPGNSGMLFAFEDGPYNWPLSWGGSSADTENGESHSCSLQVNPPHLDFTPDADYNGMKGRWCEFPRLLG